MAAAMAVPTERGISRVKNASPPSLTRQATLRHALRGATSRRREYHTLTT